MKKTLVIATILLSGICTPAVAQNKVVVIPMGGNKTVNVTNWAGNWAPGTSYQAGQTVQIDGSTYVCLTTHVSGDTPDFGYWGMMTAKGEQGDPGPQGPQGDLGPQGATGNDGISCWDLNANNACDKPVEDSNSDDTCDANDCQGPQGLAGSGGVKVYDNGGQYLGILLSMNSSLFTTAGCIDIFNPTLNLVIPLDKSNGRIFPSLSFPGLYSTSQCNNNTLGINNASYTGYLFLNPQSSSATYPYISFSFPYQTVGSSLYRANIDGSSSCVPDISTTAFPSNYYTAAQIPITFPVTFPLQYVSP